MKRALIKLPATALTLALAGILSTGVLRPASAQSAATQVSAAEQSTTFAIKNMTCALCPITVRKAIEGVKGVKSVTVDFGAKTATVVYDPTVASVDAIAAASTNAGYPARATRS